MLPRLVEAFHEASLLLLARDVQKEFEEDCPLPHEVVFEVRDVGESLIPDSLADASRGQPLPPDELCRCSDRIRIAPWASPTP